MTRKPKYQLERVKVVNDISQSLGKLPPTAIEAEESVLGAIISEKNALVEVASILRVEHFYLEKHQEIFRAVQEMFGEGTPIDMRTLVYHLRKNGKLELVGGAMAVAELTSKVSSSANIEHHSRILVEMGMKRSLIEMSSEVHQDSYDDTSDVFNVVERTNLRLQEILDNAIGTRADKSMKDIAFNVLKEVTSRKKGNHSGLDSGYPEVDNMLSGFNKTNLIIIAARPGMGKTAWVMQAGKNIAQNGHPVGIFSLEMGANELVERMVCSEAEMFADKVKKGELDDYEQSRFIEFTGQLSRLPLYIDDTPFMTIVELRARAMRMKTKYGIKLLIVDYLQLIKGINELGRNSTRDQEIGMITRTLKGIAKELDTPVIALSQLSRSVETRGGLKRPMLSDLRESGSIEQDADIVMFLYRPEYYKITQDEDGNPTHGLCECIVEKHRGGPTGTVKLKFIGKYTKFTQWISEYQAPSISERQKYADKHYKNPTEELHKDDEERPF
jgi:replicative DNA helicase